jgi:phage terminase large subunit
LDEAEELTDEDTFDKIDQSVRVKTKPNRVILILNPTTKEHWIWGRFYANRDILEGFNGIKNGITYIHTTYLDNVDNLSQSFLNQIAEIRRRRPEKYTHQILGGWMEKQEGVIFTNWRVGEFNDNYEIIYGQDFGFSVDPSTLVKLSIDKGNKRIFIKVLFCKTGMSTTQIADYNIRYAGPNLIISDSSEPRLIKEIKLKGSNIRPTIKRKGSILSGIALLQDFDLIIDPDSTELIKELNNYVWATKGQTKPVDKWNHCIDAIRYAAQYALVNYTKGSYSIR